VGPPGHEHTPLAGSKTAISGEGGAKSDARRSADAAHDPNLARLIGAWPKLSKTVRREILRLADQDTREEAGQ